MSKNISTYYSYDKIMSYNATYNFIVGPRGNGKTYGAKRLAIRAWIKKGWQFIYLRRYRDEIRGRGTFFADIAYEFPDWDFRVQGMEAQAAPTVTRDEKKREWQTIGYFMTLSTSQARKSEAYPNVRYILYDEFIIEKSSIRYLPNEPKIMNDLYSTIDRYNDRVRVLFMANTISVMNPYFLEYEIRPDQTTEIGTSHGGFIAWHFPDSEAFRGEVYATKFGRFIAQTEYAEYSVEGQFSDNHDGLLESKDPLARYRFTLETKYGRFSVWLNPFDNVYYLQEKRPKDETVITLVPEKHNADSVLVKDNDKLVQFLKTSFRKGRMFFDTPKTRNAFIEVFRR